jgi:ankyrin repeat protein
MSTPLITACRTGQTDVVRLLLADVDPSFNENAAICSASKHGHLDIVKMLLADPRVNPSVFSNTQTHFDAF